MQLADTIRSIPDFPIPGILFRDITPMLENAEAFRQAVEALVVMARDWGRVDLVAAPEARGFIFALPVAMQLGVGFLPIRKPGKLPYKTVSMSYELEYGVNTVQMHDDVVKPGMRILLVDDLLATGGTMDACRALIEENGGEVAGAAFVIELLGLGGREKIQTKNIGTILQFD